MRRASLLAKLFKQGMLQLVEPSDGIKSAYLVKSESNLISAKILLRSGKLEESVGLAYYSMYHSITALLFKVGIKCENHAAAIMLLKDLFGIDNSGISFAKRERIDKQYYVDFHITREEVGEMIKLGENFNKQLLDFISKVNNKDIIGYRDKFKMLIR